MSVVDTVQKYLQEKGLNEKAVAGVMGNIQQESSFDPSATNASSGAFGLFQWLGSRKTNLERYAKNTGGSVTSVETQLDFFWYELNTSEKKSKNVLLNSNYNTASEYAKAFENSFERSGGSALKKRQEYAENFYTAMGNNSIGEVFNKTTNETIKRNTDIGLTWWGDVVKVVLILLLILLGVVMGVLSFDSTKKG